MEALGLNKRGAAEMVDGFFGEIATALEAGHVVRLTGFDKFWLQNKRHPGRNPKTGQLIPILARRVVPFNASSKLRASILPPTRRQ